MWEYICFDKKENKEFTLFGYNLKDAYRRRNISEEYAYRNITCVHQVYID